MTTTATGIRSGREIREALGHPVIDVDGHLVEFLPPLEDYVKEIGGPGFGLKIRDEHQPRDPSDEEWRRTRAPGVWWPTPTKNVRDRATSALPALLYERMEELGLDYTVLFPTTTPRVQVYRIGSEPTTADPRYGNLDPEVEHVRYRAFNAFRADLVRPYADRMTAAAYVPMITPQAAIEELDYAVQTLGMKVVSIHAQRRPIPALQKTHPELYPSVFWLDTFGLDSPYDYDPFWARCVELKIPVMCHGGSFGFTSRNSPTNAVYNHIGHAADGNETLCKSLFLGGVTRRFPGLRVAFLECGVSWGCRVYCDMIDRWHKRNKDAIHNYNPEFLDRDEFVRLHEQYGDDRIKRHLGEVLEVSTNVNPEPYGDREVLDDFARCGIERPEDIRDLFVPNYFFGCEADDPTNAWAFDEKVLPFGVHLNAVFSSDIGHWDVPDMSKVLHELYEQVEDGRLTEANLREFAFSNTVKLMCGANPDFFRGTAVEHEVAAEQAALRG